MLYNTINPWVWCFKFWHLLSSTHQKEQLPKWRSYLLWCLSFRIAQTKLWSVLMPSCVYHYLYTPNSIFKIQNKIFPHGIFPYDDAEYAHKLSHFIDWPLPNWIWRLNPNFQTKRFLKIATDLSQFLLQKKRNTKLTLVMLIR